MVKPIIGVLAIVAIAFSISSCSKTSSTEVNSDSTGVSTDSLKLDSTNVVVKADTSVSDSTKK